MPRLLLFILISLFTSKNDTMPLCVKFPWFLGCSPHIGKYTAMQNNSATCLSLTNQAY